LSASPPFWDSEDDEDPIVLEIISEERQKLPQPMFLDFGPALPRRYGVDRLQTMVQSPLRVFAYWELRDTTLMEALEDIPAEDRQNFQLLLRWKDEDAAREWRFDMGIASSWWFDTQPEHRYRLELGLYWDEYGWLPLLASKELATPRLALGPAAPDEPPHTPALLEELVQQAGIGLAPGEPVPRSQASTEPEAPESLPAVIAHPPSREQETREPAGEVVLTGADRPTSGW
jgi:hypothetical protein